jgi:hypothetical protein
VSITQSGLGQKWRDDIPLCIRKVGAQHFYLYLKFPAVNTKNVAFKQRINASGIAVPQNELLSY